MNRDEIVEELFRMQDKDYAALQAKIIPSAAADRIIGVRTPALRAFAKRLSKDNDVKVFLSNLPHQYFDEDQLHAFVISLEKEFDKCIEEVEAFLPFVDNWATCDQLSPKAFKKEPEKLLPYIGQEVEVTVNAYGNDGQNEGLGVEIDESIPYFGADQKHVTLSIAEGAAAVNTG
jgi:3-methyladenine DNA glycosylase AlkD